MLTKVNRYHRWAAGLATVNVLRWPRCSNGPGRVRSSTATQLVPSADPSRVHCRGLRSGTSFALTIEKLFTATGVESSVCHCTVAGGSMTHHFVSARPSMVACAVSFDDVSYGPPGDDTVGAASPNRTCRLPKFRNEPNPVTLVS